MNNSTGTDLEIIYNLQWHSSIVRYNGDYAYTGTSGIVIGMYDIPETTLNWSTFKSYLLKNSGIARDLGDDIEVSYDSGRGVENVSSQREFQIALYHFRRKARMGLIVKLRVSRIPEDRLKHSNDVETQYSTCCNSHSPPDWFINYMAHFKKNFLEEVTCTVSGLVNPPKPSIVAPHHIRKPKPERLKKTRKTDIDGDHGTKEELKSSKIEGKLNRKLENLEHKTKKIIEKKLALSTKSSGTDEGASNSKIQTQPEQETEQEDYMSLLDAAAINRQVVPHMVGGETYTHEWQVINSGKIPWTDATSLVYTWGSKELLPVYDTIPAPLLKPGETGTISALIRIPFIAGQYECYWHFHHKKYRFGQWLGCQVIVDPFDLRGNRSVLQMTDPSRFYGYQIKDQTLTQAIDARRFYEYPIRKDETLTQMIDARRFYEYQIKKDDTLIQHPMKAPCAESIPAAAEQHKPGTLPKHPLTEEKPQKAAGEDTSKVDVYSQNHIDSNCSSDDDNQSIISVAESSSSKGLAQDYVVVPIPDCFKIDGNSSTSSTRSTIVDVESTKHSESDFEIIMIDGQQVAVPKRMLNSGYLDTEALNKEPFVPDTSNYTFMCKRPLSTPLSPDPSITDSMPNLEPSNDLSHCSAAGSCFSEMNNTTKITKRMFMFPEDCPGFEVVNSEDEHTEEKNTVEKYEKVSWFPEDGPGYAVANSGPLNHPGCLFSAPVSKVPNIESAGSGWFDRLQNPFASSVQQVIPNQSQVLQAENNSEHPGKQTLPINVSSTVSITPRSMTPELDSDAARIRTISEQLPELPQPAPIASETRRAPVPELNVSTATDSIPTAGVFDNASGAPTESERQAGDAPNTVHILPETLVNGAVSVASSAFHKARSVINRIVPQEISHLPIDDDIQNPQDDLNWVTANPTTVRERNLLDLAEMGFWNRSLNISLLSRYKDDLARVVEELI